MKNAEEEIAKVLAGLREVEAPEGMERRIAARLQERELAAQTSGFGWKVGSPWALRLAVVSVAMVLGSVVAVRWVGHHEHTRQARGQVRVSDVHRAGEHPVHAGERRTARLQVRSEMEPATERRNVAVKREDAREETFALAEMRAPTLVAPDVPLTQQERLLLRIVRRGDPQELALLDPAVRAAEAAREEEEFNEFFAVPVAAPIPIANPDESEGEAAPTTTNNAPSAAGDKATAPDNAPSETGEATTTTDEMPTATEGDKR